MAVSDFARARIGSVLSEKWRLDELLGRGGMATVYAGTHTRNRSRVAVKVLHPELGREPALRTRFLREGYVANSIDHPGIVRVFDDAAEGDSVYLVMELLKGNTLKETWKKSDRAMPLKDIARVISSILDVLAVAHEAGIVHRDIKPDNVFITDDGAVKVLDFGIAFIQELRSSGEHATTTGTTLGTPAFMPSEQALGKWALVDHRADIFSVGATARLLLTGRLTHEAAGSTELLIAAATKHVAPVSSVSPNVPAGIAAVVDRAVAFEREDRYQSALEMKADWDRALAAAIASGTESVAPPPPSSTAQVVSWGSGAKVESSSGQAAVASAQGAVEERAKGGSSSNAPTAIAAAIASPGVSMTESAVAKDTRAPPRTAGRRLAALGVVGLVAAVVVVIGVLAMGGRDRSAASSTIPNTSDAESVPVGSGPLVTEPMISPASSGEATSTTAASSAAPVAAPSAVARQARSNQPRPSQIGPGSSSPPSPKTQACPPVLYGRDMNDQPEYRCCGKPCSR